MGECVIREKGEIWRVSRPKPRSGRHWERGWQHALVEVTLRQVLGLGPNFLFLTTCRPLWYLGISQESTFNSCLTSEVYCCCLIAKLCQTLCKPMDCQIRSDQISRSVVSDSLRPHESQHARPPCPSPTPGVRWDSRPSSQWCHPDISSSVIPFSFCPQSLPASGSFPISQLLFV